MMSNAIQLRSCPPFLFESFYFFLFGRSCALSFTRTRSFTPWCYCLLVSNVAQIDTEESGTAFGHTKMGTAAQGQGLGCEWDTAHGGGDTGQDLSTALTPQSLPGTF